MFHASAPVREVFLGDFDDAADDGAAFGRVAAVKWATPTPLTASVHTRDQALRAIACVCLVMVAGLALLGGPGVALDLLARLVPPENAAPQAPPRPVSPALTRAPLPFGDWRGATVHLAPNNGAANTAYACWVDAPPRELGQYEAPLEVALFDAAHGTWRALARPEPNAALCDVAADIAAPQHAVLAVVHLRRHGASCPPPSLYQTADGGATWAGIPWPADSPGACQLLLTVDGGRIYLLGSTPLLTSGVPPSATAGRFIVTADGGRSWRAADSGLAAMAGFAPVAFRPGGRVLAQGTEPGDPGRTALWQSDDAGAHWERLGTAPGTGAEVFASSDPAAMGFGGWGRLYAAGVSDGGGVPGARPAPLWAAGAARPLWSPALPITRNSGTSLWESLPAPPGSHALTTIPAGTWFADGAEGPGETLLLARQAPGGVGGVTLVLWDGRDRVVGEYALPPNTLLQGVSWHQGQMRVWASAVRGAVGRETQVVVFTIQAPGQS